MTGLFDSTSGVLGRRLFTTTWVPVLVFGALVTVLVLSATGWSLARGRWDGLSADLRGLAIVLFLAVTVLLTQLLAAVRPGIIRLFEGYWDAVPLLRRIARRCARRLDDPVERSRRPWSLPAPEEMLPTRFGNIIRAAEQEARRYGMDAATAWPRLYVTLPETFTTHFAAAAGAVDLAVTISSLGAVFAVVGGGFAAVALPWYAAAYCAGGGALTCWLGHQAAVRAAVAYGELIRTAFDVHRWLLLDAMGLTRPTGLNAEREQWRQIHQVWQRGVPDAGQAHLLGYPPASGQQSDQGQVPST
ncbi:hypothetical protein ACFVT5_14150 [Streptomyces sp. NPDC058001]|uniref:hypothetical protein n=1 Tax=Streptomyces sp. NPDC058001 TaxID=3346300 RepID=UPI0036E12C96